MKRETRDFLGNKHFRIFCKLFQITLKVEEKEGLNKESSETKV